jgi:hypothetical protein
MVPMKTIGQNLPRASGLQAELVLTMSVFAQKKEGTMEQQVFYRAMEAEIASYFGPRRLIKVRSLIEFKILTLCGRSR